MHELRLVAVSEDGTYLVLASTGRGTRFMLPVDDRLRAAVRGQFSRLGQYEIEVENPLRPKEIQARIRSGETAEAISEISGIPIERVRWFEGPVLQEREYIAQQAQRATVRSHGDAAPGPSLGELVTKRIGAHQLETGDAVWDSWKREDRTWQLKLVFLHGGAERVAHWLYEPRHNSVSPADEEAARFSSPDPLDAVPAPGANVTPFTPRRGESVDPPRVDTVPPLDRRTDTAPRPFARDTPLDDPLRPAVDGRADTERARDQDHPPRRRPLDAVRDEAPGPRSAERHPADRYERRAEPPAEYARPERAERTERAERPEPADRRRDDRAPEPGPAPAAPAAQAEAPVQQRPRRAAPDWPQEAPPAHPEAQRHGGAPPRRPRGATGRRTRQRDPRTGPGQAQGARTPRLGPVLGRDHVRFQEGRVAAGRDDPAYRTRRGVTAARPPVTPPVCAPTPLCPARQRAAGPGRGAPSPG